MNRAAAFVMTMFTLVGDRFEGRKERGATAVEYGLMVGLIAVAIIVAVTALGTRLDGLFESVTSKLPTGA
ncbi:Flp family type IVb pilin [Georgenia muralis]